MAEANYWRQRPNRRRFLAAGGTLGFATAAAGLIGCSTSNNANNKPVAKSSASAAAPSAAAATPAARPSGTAALPAASAAATVTRAAGTPTAAAVQPKPGGAIVVSASTGEQPHHDVDLSASGVLHIRGSGISYNRLLRRKQGADIGGQEIVPEGDLAASWEQPDETTYVLKLRPGVKWQNIAPVSGRAFAADDVVYSIKRQLDLKATATFIPGVDQYSAMDSSTVKITTKKPDADFIAVLAAPHNKVIAHEAVELKGDIKDGPVIGTGAWIFKEWIPNDTIRFERNPDYFRPGFPYGDRLELLRITDASTNLAALRTKQILVLGPTGGDPTKQDADSLKRSNPDLVVQEGYEAAYGDLFFAVRADMPPTNDIRVRQALSKAIDRKTIVQSVVSGLGSIQQCLLNAISSDQLLPAAEAEKLLAQDLTAAKQLAQQAGFTSWNPDCWVYSLQAPNVASAELIQAQIKALGVNPNIQQMDNNKLNAWYLGHDLPMVVTPVAAAILGPSAFLNNLYHTGGARNVTGLSDPQLDQLIDSQGTELKDKQRRNQLLQDAQRRIIELAALTPLFRGNNETLYWPFVHNIFGGRTLEPAYYEQVWRDQ